MFYQENPPIQWASGALDRKQPRYPMIWQCVGMIVGVYGVGYICAAYDPVRHWPIVLVGFLGKIFGPIGFAYYLYLGAFPMKFAATILTNDLIWWIPFGLMLKAAWDAEQSPRAQAQVS
ncbi:MAG: alkyl hydroperoxide reductase [Bacteroidota bacterium]